MISETINNIPLTFETSKDLFSPHGVDKGTLSMLSVVNFSQSDKVLDLGCGYGIVGIYAAKLIGAQNVIMSDIDEKSIEFARKNAEINGVGDVKIVLSDGFKNIEDNDFTVILSNPPYHADFSIPKHFIEKGFNRLVIGGMMYMVTRRRDWYKNKFTAIFGGAKIHEIDGYYIFCAQKRKSQYAGKT